MATDHETLQLIDDDPITYAALAVLGAVVIAALSQIVVPYPLSDTPYDVATAGVYLAGLVLGPVWGAVSLGVYLLAYALDVPFFAPETQLTTGYEVLVGPLGGYLLTYPLAAAVVGGLVHGSVYPKPLGDVSVRRQAGALAVGIFLVYPVGSVWLGLNTEFPLGGAVIVGGLTFLPGEAIMALLALVVGAGGYYALGRAIEE